MGEANRERKGRGRPSGDRDGGRDAQPDPSTAAAAGAAGAEFLAGVFEQLGRNITVAVDAPRADTIVLRVSGDDVGGLKRRPELVTALSQLSTQVIGRAVGERWQCVFDLDGNLAAREALLATAARDVAEAVVANGRRAVFEGLASTERRVVHLAIQDDARVRTWSEGEAAERCLLVERNAR
jgi:spoIIIJ-associated protein